MARTDPRPHLRKGLEINCSECGHQFYAYPSQVKNGKSTCSIECRDKAKRRKLYDDENQTKLCACCGQWLPFSLFKAVTGEKSGENSLQAYCSPCALEKNKNWVKENKERRAKTQRRSAEKRRGVKNNLTPEQRKRKNALHRAWRKKNASRVRMWNRIRVHRLRAAGDMPKSEDLNRLLAVQDGKCAYCGGLLESAPHLDHMVPVSKGGTNSIKNLQWLCGPCNLKKGVVPHAEYVQRLNCCS